MHFSIYLTLLLSVLIAVTGPATARWLSTSAASGTMAATALVAAAASTWALLLLAATLLNKTAFVQEQAADRGVRLPIPVPSPLGVVGLVALSAGLYRAGRSVLQRRATIYDLRHACAASSSANTSREDGESMVVVPSPALEAVAVPGPWGRGGQILVTQGMLQALDGPGRRAMLAHEQSHLRHHHYWHRAAADLAASLNPLLIPMRESTAFLIERRADEYAAGVLGDRSATARALARVALIHGDRRSRSRAAFGYHRLQVSRRVAALIAPPPTDRRLPALFLLGLLAATIACELDATLSFIRLIDPLFPK